MQNTSSASTTVIWTVHYTTKNGVHGAEITTDVPGTIARLEALEYIVGEIIVN